MKRGLIVWLSIILLIIILIIFLVQQDIINIEINKKTTTSKASLGKEFTLKENQSIAIKNEDLEIKIVEFIYSPCPPDSQCFWSGLRVTLEITKGSEQTSMNFELKGDSRFVFDYKVSMIDTDYKTYVDLKVDKITN